MKITIVMGFFLPVPPVRGGATEKIWHRFAREFAGAGHEVTVISRRWPGFPDDEVVNGIRYLRLRGRDHSRHLAANLVLDLLWSIEVLAALPTADVVVSNNVSLPIFVGQLKPRAGKVAVVLGRMPKGQTRLYGGVDRVLATSTAVFRKAAADSPRIVPRVRVMLNPVDAAELERSNVKPQPNAPLTIGYVGRVHPEKGLETLIDAAVLLSRQAELPPWRIMIIGPHEVQAGGGGEGYRTALINRAAGALKSGQVDLVGPVFDSTALARHYGVIDLFCYPTRAEQGEGLSVAPIEAMAAGAVPIVSQLPCFDDLIRPGENGMTFDHRATDPAAQLAACLRELLIDVRLRRKLAAQAQSDARQFDYQVIASRLLKDFSSLLKPT